MTDAQIITIAITVLAILGGTLVNNTRLGDLKDLFRAEVGVVRGELGVVRSEVREEIAAIRHLIERNQDTLLTELSRFDQRLTRLEERSH